MTLQAGCYEYKTLKILIGHGAPFWDISFLKYGGKGWLGVWPYIYFWHYLVSNLNGRKLSIYLNFGKWPCMSLY